MAIDMREFKKLDVGLYQHTKDKCKFLLRYMNITTGKRSRKLIKVSADTHTNMALLARNQLELLKGTVVANKTVHDIYTLWVESSTWKQTTLDFYTRTYKLHIKDFIGTKFLADVTPSHIDTILNRVDSIRLKKSIVEVLFPIFSIAIDDDYIDKSPLKKRHKIKRDTKAEKKLVDNAVAKYKAVNSAIMSLDTAFNRAFMLFGFHGRRIGETKSMKWTNISFDADTYKVEAKDSKVGSDMIFALPSDLKAELLQMERVSEWVFDSPKIAGQHVTDMRDVVAKVRAVAGIEGLTYHWLRNLAVTALFEMGVALGDLSSMLGHTDFTTLKKYLTQGRKEGTSRTNAVSERFLNDNT